MCFCVYRGSLKFLTKAKSEYFQWNETEVKVFSIRSWPWKNCATKDIDREIESYLNDKLVFDENARTIDSIRSKFNETENHESFKVNEFVKQVTLLNKFIDVRKIKAAIKIDQGNKFFLTNVSNYPVINQTGDVDRVRNKGIKKLILCNDIEGKKNW